MKSVAPYRCVASSAAGFVQQLAVSYIAHGYWFYVTGEIPPRKDPAATDRKLIEHYGIGISKWARARRKRAGLANVHYLRLGRFFVLLASKGEHRFFEEETKFRDVRRDSISFDGYSIGYKRDARGGWHPSVRIHSATYRNLKDRLIELALHRTENELLVEFGRLNFAMYAPVRSQVLAVWRAVNSRRSEAGLAAIGKSCLNLRRKPVVVFGPASNHLGS